MKKIIKSITIMSMFLMLLIISACSNNAEGDGLSSNDDTSYPEKDIDVYVGHGAGGGTDIFVRTVTDIMSEDLGVNFNVINKEGGAGVVAMQEAMQKPADGYTIVGDANYAITTAAGENVYGLDQV